MLTLSSKRTRDAASDMTPQAVCADAVLWLAVDRQLGKPQKLTGHLDLTAIVAGNVA